MTNDKFVILLEKSNVNYNYGWGSVGDGWLPLLEQLFIDLIDLGWNRKVAQIKEKFGGARIYIHEGSDEIHKRIDKAEADSYKICEDCGNPGTVGSKNGGYWIRTLCTECRNKEK